MNTYAELIFSAIIIRYLSIVFQVKVLCRDIVAHAMTVDKV